MAKSNTSTSAPPPAPSSTPYIVGILLFGAGIAALLYSRCSAETLPKPQANTVPTAVAPEPTEELPDFAPPPPPEVEDAGPDADADAAPSSRPTGTGNDKPGTAAAGPGGPCAKCGQGKHTSALVSAVKGTAGTAQGCHNRALRGGGVQGRMTVAVSVGSTGAVCGASVISDSTGHAGLKSCVVAKFAGRSYPKPESGCVTVNVPLNFKSK